MRKLRQVINKPFQIGFSVLEWSKLKMAEFYALLKDAFGDKVRMLTTDTDSFFLQFFVDDLAKEINARPQVRDAFHFSEIIPGHISNLARSNAQLHAGEVGYFKDECKGDQIVEFVGLRPKMYSFKVMEAVEYDARLPPLDAVHFKHKAVAKGVSRANIKNFTHGDYVAMFREGEARNVTNRRIGSKLHQVFLIVNYGQASYFILFSNLADFHTGAREALAMSIRRQTIPASRSARRLDKPEHARVRSLFVGCGGATGSRDAGASGCRNGNRATTAASRHQSSR